MEGVITRIPLHLTSGVQERLDRPAHGSHQMPAKFRRTGSRELPIATDGSIKSTKGQEDPSICGLIKSSSLTWWGIQGSKISDGLGLHLVTAVEYSRKELEARSGVLGVMFKAFRVCGEVEVLRKETDSMNTINDFCCTSCALLTRK